MSETGSLRRVEVDDVVVFATCQYASIKPEVFKEQFERLRNQGKIRSSFEDHTWVASSGIKTCILDFQVNDLEYARHMKRRLNVSASQIEHMLKCYALSLCGEYIFITIKERIKEVKNFLKNYNGRKYHTNSCGKLVITEFLEFIGTPDAEINKIGFYLHEDSEPGIRDLKPLVNYLVISDVVQKLYADPHISDEEFIRWFPIYFWSQISFILPLRATEMLVTPMNCIRRDGDEVHLLINRTQLKKKHHVVNYEVEKDYKRFDYKIPDSEIVVNIEKYINLTADQPRRFLFAYSYTSTNEILSLMSFTRLLECFIDTFVIGNTKYEYVKYASGIDEFEYVNAGDSRVIAITNLTYQDAGLDIARQLADHENLTTTFGYGYNVAKTIWASSIMSMQQKINLAQEEVEKEKRQTALSSDDVYGCQSPLQPKITGNISDCVREGHIDIDECMGCTHYHPTEEEIEREMKERQEKVDTSSRAIFEILQKKSKDGREFDKIFLDAQTNALRYKAVCEEEAKKTWQRYANTMTI